MRPRKQGKLEGADGAYVGFQPIPVPQCEDVDVLATAGLSPQQAEEGLPGAPMETGGTGLNSALPTVAPPPK